MAQSHAGDHRHDPHGQEHRDADPAPAPAAPAKAAPTPAPAPAAPSTGQTAPDPNELRYALAQFGLDATRWSDTGRTLGKAAREAQDLTLHAAAFGPGALWLAGTYDQLQTAISQRLTEGTTVFADVSSNLLEARDAYQRDEDNHVHAMKKMW
jgi:hypothetical protein